MLNAITRCLRDERGQGMTEYILIVTLVALAAIASWTYFKTVLKQRINFAATSLQNS